MIVTFENMNQVRAAHDKALNSFMETNDLKYFEAARAIAVAIMEYERTYSAYRNHDLYKMYPEIQR